MSEHAAAFAKLSVARRAAKAAARRVGSPGRGAGAGTSVATGAGTAASDGSLLDSSSASGGAGRARSPSPSGTSPPSRAGVRSPRRAASPHAGGASESVGTGTTGRAVAPLSPTRARSRSPSPPSGVPTTRGVAAAPEGSSSGAMTTTRARSPGPAATVLPPIQGPESQTGGSRAGAARPAVRGRGILPRPARNTAKQQRGVKPSLSRDPASLASGGSSMPGGLCTCQS
jgi:hypothetical protein